MTKKNTDKPATLPLPTFGLDIERTRFRLPPRTHRLTERTLQACSAPEIVSAQRGAMMAVMSAHLGGESTNVAIALVRMQKLTIELATRLLDRDGEPFEIVINETDYKL